MAFECVAIGRNANKRRCTVEGCDRAHSGKGFCNLHYQRMLKHHSLDAPVKVKLGHSRPPCTVEGCDKLARSPKGPYCEAHYMRVRRNGTVGLKIRPATYISVDGYVLISGRTGAHPVRSPSGQIYLHRKVLYDDIGPGEHPCHWCSRPVEWHAKGDRRLVVDHLDGDKQHNDRTNLVPSCHRCNSFRGLFMSWVMKHKDDPFLMSLFTNATSDVA